MIYSAWSSVNSVQVVLSGLSMKLLSFVYNYNVYRYGGMYALAALLLMCVDQCI